MKHVLSNEKGWHLDSYFEYLRANRAELPVEVFDFASEIRNYDFVSHESLHDAWLEWIRVREPASGQRSEIRGIEIDCRFLGPYHDLYIDLKYKDVRSYCIAGPIHRDENSSLGNGDLLMHEVRLEDGLVVHEMTFSTGARIEISCRTFSRSIAIVG